MTSVHASMTWATKYLPPASGTCSTCGSAETSIHVEEYRVSPLGATTIRNGGVGAVCMWTNCPLARPNDAIRLVIAIITSGYP